MYLGLDAPMINLLSNNYSERWQFCSFGAQNINAMSRAMMRHDWRMQAGRWWQCWCWWWQSWSIHGWERPEWSRVVTRHYWTLRAGRNLEAHMTEGDVSFWVDIAIAYQVTCQVALLQVRGGESPLESCCSQKLIKTMSFLLFCSLLVLTFANSQQGLNM